MLTQSIFSLCPRGFGPTSFRLYESIQLGAIPIYVSDKFHLPYKNFIDWEKLCLLIDINEIENINYGAMTDESINFYSDYEKNDLDKGFNDFYQIHNHYKNIREILLNLKD